MSVVVLAPPETTRQLASRLGASSTPRAVALNEAMRLLERSDHGCLVLDPCGLREDQFEHLASVVRLTRMTVVGYTTRQGILRVARLESASAIELVISGEEDDVSLLQKLVAAEAPSVLAMVRVGLSPKLEHLPPRLRAGVHELFGWGLLPEDVNAFSSPVGRSPTTINRWLAVEGLAPLSVLIGAANVARMGRWLSPDARDAFESVAANHSNVGARRLRELFRSFTGLAPSRAVRDLTHAEMARRIVARVSLRRDSR
jgi:hypothetical protein